MKTNGHADDCQCTICKGYDFGYDAALHTKISQLEKDVEFYKTERDRLREEVKLMRSDRKDFADKADEEYAEAKALRARCGELEKENAKFLAHAEKCIKCGDCDWWDKK